MTQNLSYETLSGALDRVMSLSRAPQTEARVSADTQASIRFAENAVTQNSDTTNISCSIRLMDGRRHTTVQLNQLDDASIQEALARGLVALPNAPEDDDVLSPVAGALEGAHRWHHAKNVLSADARARCVERAIDEARRGDQSASGFVCAERMALAYANSAGRRAYFDKTSNAFSLSMRDSAGENEGWAEATSADGGRLDADRVIADAIDHATSARGARPINPGVYEAVLSPFALQELMYFFVTMAFMTKPYIENRSPLSGKLGQKLFSERLTVRDDWSHPEILGMPFDYEGMPRQKVTLIQNGVLNAFVHDRLTARAAGAAVTGHSLPQPNSAGPIPTCLVFDGDNGEDADLIADLKDGLYVSKFHYCNIVDPMELSVTGMTRGGVYAVKNGAIAHPVKNFRFTVSLLDLFGDIKQLGRPRYTEGALFGGGCVVPPMRCGSFRMSSATDF